MNRRFASRSAFQLEMQLTGCDDINSLTDPDEFRIALQVLSQRTRFQVFRLVCSYPGQLSLDDLSSELGGSREKLYHHLYQMLRVSVIVAQGDLRGRKCFSPNQRFLSQAGAYFTKFQLKLRNEAEPVSKVMPVEKSDVGPTTASD